MFYRVDVGPLAANENEGQFMMVPIWDREHVCIAAEYAWDAWMHIATHALIVVISTVWCELLWTLCERLRLRERREEGLGPRHFGFRIGRVPIKWLNELVAGLYFAGADDTDTDPYRLREVIPPGDPYLWETPTPNWWLEITNDAPSPQTEPELEEDAPLTVQIDTENHPLTRAAVNGCRRLSPSRIRRVDRSGRRYRVHATAVRILRPAVHRRPSEGADSPRLLPEIVGSVTGMPTVQIQSNAMGLPAFAGCRCGL